MLRSTGFYRTIRLPQWWPMARGLVRLSGAGVLLLAPVAVAAAVPAPELSVHPAAASSVAAAAGAKVYVGLFADNAVAVVDAGDNRVLATIPVPSGPHGMA